MAIRIRTVRDHVEFRAAVSCIGHYFGWQPSEEDGERFSTILPFDRLHAAVDGTAIVGGAGSYPFELTVPGGPLPCAGVTVVGVLPSHRRRGLLRRMMEAQLKDVREREEPIAALWASEETIYGRFGYGLASLCHNISVEHRAGGLRAGLPAAEGQVRLVDHEEAMRIMPRLYDRIRTSSVGFLSRTRSWWELRQLGDRPDQRRGAGPLHRAVLELDGKPAAYALYRIASERRSGDDWQHTLRVSDAFGVDERATRELWRFLLAIDWVDEVEMTMLPVDHPVHLLVARVNRLRARVWDGLWVRLVDLGAALEARTYADGRVTFDVVSDSLFPDNVGTWTIDGGAVRRTRRRADVRLDVQAVGAAYLGGFSFAELARAQQVEETSRGGLARADALFRTAAAPWCPENF